MKIFVSFFVATLLFANVWAQKSIRNKSFRFNGYSRLIQSRNEKISLHIETFNYEKTVAELYKFLRNGLIKGTYRNKEKQDIGIDFGALLEQLNDTGVGENCVSDLLSWIIALGGRNQWALEG